MTYSLETLTRIIDHIVFVILSCPRCTCKGNTEGGKTFSVRTIKEWNSLSAELKRSPSVKCF